MGVGEGFLSRQLDWAGKLTTLRNAMKHSPSILFLPLLICLVLAARSGGSVVFNPGRHLLKRPAKTK
jgi:hypothetical protein